MTEFSKNYNDSSEFVSGPEEESFENEELEEEQGETSVESEKESIDDGSCSSESSVED